MGFNIYLKWVMKSQGYRFLRRQNLQISHAEKYQDKQSISVDRDHLNSACHVWAPCVSILASSNMKKCGIDEEKSLSLEIAVQPRTHCAWCSVEEPCLLDTYCKSSLVLTWNIFTKKMQNYIIFGANNSIMTIAIITRSEESYLMKVCLEPFFIWEFILAKVFIMVFFSTCWGKHLNSMPLFSHSDLWASKNQCGSQ